MHGRPTQISEIQSESRTGVMRRALARFFIGLVCLGGVVGSLTVFETQLPAERRHSQWAGERPNNVVEVSLSNPFGYGPRRLSPDSITNERELLSRFALAVSQPNLAEGGPDELRVLLSFADFGQTPTGVTMVGYIIRNNQIATCPVAYGNTLDEPLEGRCEKPKALKPGSPLNDWSALAGLANFDYSCGVMDGYWVTIEGRRNGAVFVLQASNPDSCEDMGSQIIASLLVGI